MKYNWISSFHVVLVDEWIPLVFSVTKENITENITDNVNKGKRGRKTKPKKDAIYELESDNSDNKINKSELSATIEIALPKTPRVIADTPVVVE